MAEPVDLEALISRTEAIDATPVGHTLGSRPVIIDNRGRFHFDENCDQIADGYTALRPLRGPHSIHAGIDHWCWVGPCVNGRAGIDAALGGARDIIATCDATADFRRTFTVCDDAVIERYAKAVGRVRRPPDVLDAELADVHRDALALLSAALEYARPMIRDAAEIEAVRTLTSPVPYGSPRFNELHAQLTQLHGPDIAIAAADTFSTDVIGAAYGPFPTEAGAGEPVTVPFIIGAALIAGGATCALDASDGSIAGTLLTDGWPSGAAGLQELVDAIGALAGAAR